MSTQGRCARGATESQVMQAPHQCLDGASPFDSTAGVSNGLALDAVLLVGECDGSVRDLEQLLLGAQERVDFVGVDHERHVLNQQWCSLSALDAFARAEEKVKGNPNEVHGSTVRHLGRTE